MLDSVLKYVISFGVATSLSASPALASASAIASQPQSISPMVALSIFGSQASATALCGTSATVAASAAAAAQAPNGGCVLPLVDAPPPPLPAAEPLPVAEPIAVSSGFGITPILLGLAGIAILAALIASQDNDNDNDQPVSVN